MDFSLQFVQKDWGQFDMTIYVKNILFLLEAWNTVPDTILAREIQIWYRFNSQTNCRVSTRAQISLFSASYTISGKTFLFVLEAWNSIPDSILVWKIQIWYLHNS